MSYGHEQLYGDCLRERGELGGGAKREIWDDYNSIINKIQLIIIPQDSPVSLDLMFFVFNL